MKHGSISYANAVSAVALAAAAMFAWLWQEARVQALMYQYRATVYRETVKLSETAVVVTVVADSGEVLIVDWSRGAQRMFGWTAAEAIGKDIRILIPKEMREAHQTGFDRAMLQGALSTEERVQIIKCNAINSNQELIPVIITTRIFAVIEGKPMIAAIIDDASHVKILDTL